MKFVLIVVLTSGGFSAEFGNEKSCMDEAKRLLESKTRQNSRIEYISCRPYLTPDYAGRAKPSKQRM